MTSYARPVPDRADADLDELVDLDDDDGSETTPGRRLPRWARSRWAVPAAVTGVVLLLGVAGLQQARASAAAEVGELRRMTSVQLGSASFFFSGAPEAGRPGADGHLEQRVQVGVRNTGDEDLRITPVSTTVEHARVVPGAEGVSLRAGTGGGMTVVLDVDCGAVPPPTSSSSGTDVPPVATDLLRLAVSTQGGSGDTAERDYLLPDAQWGGLGEQLSYACSPDAYGQALSASGQVDDDGRQTVDLFNTTDGPLRVELRTSAALRTVAEPALPAEVPPRGRLQVVLALDPDCSQLGEVGQRDPYGLQVDLVTARSDGGTNSLLDSTTGAAWVARQVALACG